MGLSIYYTGMLRREQLPLLISEVADICDDLYWPYQLIQPARDFPIEGLTFSMPGAEKMWLTFLDDGRMSSPEHIISKAIAQRNGIPHDPAMMLNTVVQYAGPDAHMRMIRMLRYISNKYFSAFQMIDESEYWESGNEEKCRDWFIMFNMWMNNMSTGLTKLDGRGHENGETYGLRLRELLRKGTPILKIIDAVGDPMGE